MDNKVAAAAKAREILVEADRDKNGWLSKSELKKLIKKDGTLKEVLHFGESFHWKAFWEELDANNDGRIVLDELTAYIEKLNQVPSNRAHEVNGNKAKQQTNGHAKTNAAKKNGGNSNINNLPNAKKQPVPKKTAETQKMNANQQSHAPKKTTAATTAAKATSASAAAAAPAPQPKKPSQGMSYASMAAKPAHAKQQQQQQQKQQHQQQQKRNSSKDKTTVVTATVHEESSEGVTHKAEQLLLRHRGQYVRSARFSSEMIRIKTAREIPPRADDGGPVVVSDGQFTLAVVATTALFLFCRTRFNL